MNCGDKCVKYLLFAFNFIFFLGGIGLIVMGSVLTAQDNYRSLIGNEEFDLCIAMIVAGCVTTIISFFGCCGAIKENTCMLYTFSVLLTLALLLELGGAIAAFVYQDDIKEHMTKEMTKSIDEYGTDEDVAREWDDLQQKFECCGASGPLDWDIVPASCCVGNNPGCDATTSYQSGCVDELASDIESNAWIIGGVALAIAVIQIFGVGIACCLSSVIKRSKRGHLV